MSDFEFNCLKCGSCCRGLFDNLEGQKRGLTLTPKESKLFPENLISPMMAIGITKPEITLLFQLNVDDCPFIDRSNKCRIYDKRPLICQSFPLNLQATYSPKCKVFTFAKKTLPKIVIDWDPSLRHAALKLDSYTINHFEKNFKKGISTWAFDLNTNQWELRNRYFVYTGVIHF